MTQAPTTQTPLVPISPADKKELTALENTVKRLYGEIAKAQLEQFDKFTEIGLKLVSIRESQWWKARAATWEAYVGMTFSFGVRRAQQIIAAAEAKEEIALFVAKAKRSAKLKSANVAATQQVVYSLLDNIPSTVPMPATERQMRPLTTIPQAQQGPAWISAVRMAGGAQPSPAQIKAVVTTVKAQNSGAPTTNKAVSPAALAKAAQDRLAATILQRVTDLDADHRKWLVEEIGKLP